MPDLLRDAALDILGEQPAVFRALRDDPSLRASLAHSLEYFKQGYYREIDPEEFMSLCINDIIAQVLAAAVTPT